MVPEQSLATSLGPFEWSESNPARERGTRESLAYCSGNVDFASLVGVHKQHDGWHGKQKPTRKEKHSFDQKYAVENRHYVTDIHATVLHQLGLDPRDLTIAGRKRLEKEYGEPIRDVIA